MKCNICKNKVTKAFEIDHIIALEVGGSDADSNLQLLCKGCHDQKTRLEAGTGTFKFDRTLSHYNKSTVEIFMKSKNAVVHNYFVWEDYAYMVTDKSGEPAYHADGSLKIKSKLVMHDNVVVAGLDMQKCRTNILLHEVGGVFADFSVLDDPVVFDVANKIHITLPPGEYEVHTRNVCPAKGNGWYTHIEVRYMIE